MNVDGTFEGDLIRPLGLVTLYFGYAEFEVDMLLDTLNGAGVLCDTPKSAPFGQRLGAVRDLLSQQQMAEAAELVSIIDEGRPLIELRNVLVHSCILAGGRVKPSEKSRCERSVTPQQLHDLANAIFTWKDELSVARQKRLMPALQRRSDGGA